MHSEFSNICTYIHMCVWVSFQSSYFLPHLQVTLVPTWLAVITATVMLIVYSLLVPILRKEKWLLPENRTNKIMFPFFAVSSLFIIILFTVFLVSYKFVYYDILMKRTCVYFIEFFKRSSL